MLGATYQPRAGIAKHDYVAWGFARRADEAGIDIIQNCEVIGFDTDGDRVTGVRTTHGDIGAGRVALCAAGHTSTLTDMLGIRTPLQSHPLQALVSELLEPVHPTIVMSNAVHVYVSQAHKGELVMGAGVDSYNGYGQRGAFHIIERQMAAAVELFPIFARAHLLRSWAGIVDVCPDASPIVGRTPYENLYLNAGWGTGGFKATPGIGWCLADTIANDEPHPYIAPFSHRPVRHRRAGRRTRRRGRRALTSLLQVQEPTACSSSNARGADRVRKRSSTTAARRTSPTPRTRRR